MGWRKYLRVLTQPMRSLEGRRIELIVICVGIRLQRRPKVADTAKLVAQSHLLHPSPTATFNLLNSTAALPDSIGRNLGLSYAQCDVGFPKLWPELLRTKELFTKGKTGKNYGITQADIDKVEENDGTRVSGLAWDGAGRGMRRVEAAKETPPSFQLG